jgi:uncharacterized damage-inducible protein DinB
MKPTELYAYHRWANHRLFDVAAALGDEACGKDVGRQFSFPTLRRMFAHLYGADTLWLMRWKGQPTTGIPGAEVATMGDLRRAWDVTEAEQRAYVEALTPADLARDIHYKDTAGRPYHAPLGMLIEHVMTHGFHHRSEVATMLTMLSGSPPDSSMLVWHRVLTGQLKA